MYTIVYALLYLLSLIPFFIMYLISDFLAFLAYNVFGYRKKIVLNNLRIAFPEKTEAERRKIAKQFYINLTDTFVETIKLLSISEKEIRRRALFPDYENVNALSAKGLNIQLHSGHQMNWEFAEWALSRATKVPIVGVYMRINNKVMSRLILKLRNQPNIILVSVQDFRHRTADVFKQQYNVALVADQNPGDPLKSNWLNFMGKAAPFPTGPEKGAKLFNPAIVFVKFVKIKRGHYKFEHTIIAESSNQLKDGELTRMFRNYLEEVIKSDPSNYLWTHRRWKHQYRPELAERWIDTEPPKV